MKLSIGCNQVHLGQVHRQTGAVLACYFAYVNISLKAIKRLVLQFFEDNPIDFLCILYYIYFRGSL
jgi:hypothetical protein